MNTSRPAIRRLLALVVTAAAGASLVACTGASPDSDSGDTGSAEVAGVTIERDDDLAELVPEEVASSGELTAIQFDNAPADTFIDENDELAGWGPDLGRAVAAVLGLEYVAEDWDLNGIYRGRPQ